MKKVKISPNKNESKNTKILLDKASSIIKVDKLRKNNKRP